MAASSMPPVPPVLVVRWCPVCGSTDRYGPMTGQHVTGRGEPCPGRAQTVTYSPA